MKSLNRIVLEASLALKKARDAQALADKALAKADKALALKKARDAQALADKALAKADKALAQAKAIQ